MALLTLGFQTYDGLSVMAYYFDCSTARHPSMHCNWSVYIYVMRQKPHSSYITLSGHSMGSQTPYSCPRLVGLKRKRTEENIVMLFLAGTKKQLLPQFFHFMKEA